MEALTFISQWYPTRCFYLFPICVEPFSLILYVYVSLSWCSLDLMFMVTIFQGTSSSSRFFGRVSTNDNKRDSSSWTRFSAWTHISMNFNCPTRELAKEVSEPMNGASERSEHGKAAENEVNTPKSRVVVKTKRQKVACTCTCTWLYTPLCPSVRPLVGPTQFFFYQFYFRKSF